MESTSLHTLAVGYTFHAEDHSALLSERYLVVPSSVARDSETWRFPPFFGEEAALWRLSRIAIMWPIWKERNGKVYKGVSSLLKEVEVFSIFINC